MRLMPRNRLGVALRALTAFVVVVGCVAGAVATGGLLQFKDIANAINIQSAIKSKEITPPKPGKPQTLLLIGVDKRYGQGGGPGNTDTMMLVRIDDSSSTINALSVPRDLAVNVPGYGMEKINSAYEQGGPNLLLKTLKADVFPTLQVNQMLLVDFASFSNLINAIGCVYLQVDHRYYNHSVGLADLTTDYSSIYLQPGYQKLCGGKESNLGGATSALSFVRFRHNDSDFVREARQQDFLQWAKESLPSGQALLAERMKLARDFGKDVQSTSGLHNLTGVLELFNLAFLADGHSIKSFPFPYTGFATINGGDDVTYSEAQAEQTYRAFLRPTRQQSSRVTTTSSTTTTSPSTRTRTGKGHHHAVPRYRPPAGMVADPADGHSQAAALGHPGLPVYYPLDIPDDFGYCFGITGNCDIGYEPSSAYVHSYPRSYRIDGVGGKRYAAYVMTLCATSGGYTDTAEGEYATIQGTTWPGAGHTAGPPILRSPSAIVTVNGKRLYEYSQGGNFAVVAWKTPKAVYWISNTLQNNIPNPEMVAMAASFTRAPA